MAAVVHFQHDFQQVATVQAKDWTPVGTNVADLLQLGLQYCGRFEGGRKDNVVDFPRAVILLVDIADLAADSESELFLCTQGAPRRRWWLHTRA